MASAKRRSSDGTQSANRFASPACPNHDASDELAELQFRLSEVAEEERKLGLAEQQLAARVEDFRVRRQSLSAQYAAAEAQTRIMESLTGVSREFAQLGAAIGRAEERI